MEIKSYKIITILISLTNSELGSRIIKTFNHYSTAFKIAFIFYNSVFWSKAFFCLIRIVPSFYSKFMLLWIKFIRLPSTSFCNCSFLFERAFTLCLKNGFFLCYSMIFSKGQFKISWSEVRIGFSECLTNPEISVRLVSKVLEELWVL